MHASPPQRRRPHWVALLCALLVMGLCAQALATTVVKMDLARLVHVSEQIVEGHVLGARSYIQQGRIYTDITIKVRARYKGVGPKSVVVRQQGGRVGDRATQVAGQARFARNEHVVVFLERVKTKSAAPGPLVVTGMSQGKFRVQTSDDGTSYVVPQIATAALVDLQKVQGERPVLVKSAPSTLHTQIQPLADLRADIAALETP